MKSNFGTLAFVAIFAALWFISCFGLNAADTARLELDDLDKAILAGAPEEAADPITLAQVTKATERTFPNLSEELDSQKLLQKTLLEPSMRGNLRGRLAEEDFLKRNAKEGWRRVKNPTAPQNDVWRRVDGKLEGGQIKVHNDWRQYRLSMVKDSKAERFFIPDDQYDQVLNDLEERRVGALRGGLTDKAAEYARQQKRLAKLGRTFSQLDGSIESAAKNCSRISAALRSGGKALPFIGIALGILDGGISVYQVAQGKMSVQECMQKVGKAGVAGVASWAAVDVVLPVVISDPPVAVIIVVGTATYFVVDYAIGAVIDSYKSASLTKNELAMLWPDGALTPVQK